ncbi:hypothetical protein D3C76_528290 [compost metagenome]
MLNDIATSIKAQLYDRVSSPLLGSFIISWCLWNWKFLLILTSGLSATEKILYIDLNIFNSIPKYILNGLAAPSAITLLIIYVYPIPARIIYRITRGHQRDLKEIQQTIDDETPMPLAEARELRQLLRSVQTQHEEELARKISENSSLKNNMLTLSSDIQSLQQQLSNAQQQAEKCQITEQVARRDKTTLEQDAVRLKALLSACAFQVNLNERTNQVDVSRLANPLGSISESHAPSDSDAIERALEQHIIVNGLFANRDPALRIIMNNVFLFVTSPEPRVYNMGELSNRNLSDGVARARFLLTKFDELSKSNKHV